MDGLGRRGIDSVSSFVVMSSDFFSSIVDFTLGGMLVELNCWPCRAVSANIYGVGKEEEEYFGLLWVAGL